MQVLLVAGCEQPLLQMVSNYFSLQIIQITSKLRSSTTALTSKALRGTRTAARRSDQPGVKTRRWNQITKAVEANSNHTDGYLCMSKSVVFQLKSWARFLLPSRYVAPYHATPEPVVRRMLQLAKVSAADTVYDIGM